MENRQLQPSAQDFEAIVAQYSQSVYNHALRLLGNNEEAEEATQDVFLAIHKSLPTFAGKSAYATWIYGITFNVCGHYRQRKQLDFAPLDDDLNSLVDPAPDPEQILIQKDASDQLERLISALPEREAEAISVYYREGASYKEIAKDLNVSAGNVAILIHRARLRLTGLAEAELQGRPAGSPIQAKCRSVNEKRGGQ